MVVRLSTEWMKLDHGKVDVRLECVECGGPLCLARDAINIEEGDDRLGLTVRKCACHRRAKPKTALDKRFKHIIW